MAKIRTFVAVDLSTGIRNAAGKLISQLRVVAADYNWVEKENLHITLNFLGDVPETEIPAVCRVVSDAANDFGSFDLSACGLGCFPHPAKPRVVWLGVDCGNDELTVLQEKLTVALEKLRFPRERRDFQPHITLGRIQRGGRYSHHVADIVGQNDNVRAGKMIVERVVVYSSFLDRVGPTYTPMSTVDLI